LKANHILFVQLIAIPALQANAMPFILTIVLSRIPFFQPIDIPGFLRSALQWVERSATSFLLPESRH
jgi:hypothetical protein